MYAVLREGGACIVHCRSTRRCTHDISTYSGNWNRGLGSLSSGKRIRLSIDIYAGSAWMNWHKCSTSGWRRASSDDSVSSNHGGCTSPDNSRNCMIACSDDERDTWSQIVCFRWRATRQSIWWARWVRTCLPSTILAPRSILADRMLTATLWSRISVRSWRSSRLAAGGGASGNTWPDTDTWCSCIGFSCVGDRLTISLWIVPRLSGTCLAIISTSIRATITTIATRASIASISYVPRGSASGWGTRRASTSLWCMTVALVWIARVTWSSW